MLSKGVQALAKTASRVPSAFGGSKLMSTVAAHTIHLNFVDVEGNTARIPARIGQTILEVAVASDIDLEGPCGGGGSPTEVRRSEDWVETTYGEGPGCFICHVQIPSSWNHVLPEQTNEMKEGMDWVWDEEINLSSRLACQIVLKREMDGMTVYVPDAPPTDII